LSLAKCTTPIYQKQNGSCACGFFLQRGLYWREAADQCYGFGGRLPEVKSEKENKDIYALMVKDLIRMQDIVVMEWMIEYQRLQEFQLYNCKSQKMFHRFSSKEHETHANISSDIKCFCYTLKGNCLCGMV
jgi:hypothetical protein